MVTLNFCVSADQNIKHRRIPMEWTTPSICEVAVGMEVTAYESAEDVID